MTPIRNQVLVKPYPSDEISVGGIYVPLSAREVSNKVYIVGVGNGTKDRKMHLSPGQTGYRVRNWGCEVEVNGEKHFIMDMGDIIALS